MQRVSVAPDTQTIGRAPLDKVSACRRQVYLTTNNIDKRQKTLPSEDNQPAIRSSDRPHTYKLDNAGPEKIGSQDVDKNRLICSKADVTADQYKPKIIMPTTL